MYDGVCTKCGSVHRDVLATNRAELLCCGAVMDPVFGTFAYGNIVPANGGIVEGIGHFDSQEEYDYWKSENPNAVQLIPGTGAHSEYMDRVRGRKQHNSEKRGFKNPKQYAAWNKRVRAMAAGGDQGAKRAIEEYGQRKW